ncbi:hypothetical protein QBC46DRAFT_363603 [Diplogelasinospora grovesii]|uniref:Deubiquitination-protection protein dph1 n=1 Tax=Diplogelasinospora grovesii TaxID=303347 RepID=A0AAN6S4Q4_9PEZI|nr:hypothetical protein QBC46DRAFT_363603 [Diplogelasinospora grovesii]
MADNSETAGDAPAQVSFKVKTSGDKSHNITMSESATVLDLKTKLAEKDYEDVPVERQRLIYSGRVMKNDDALSVYKIKAGNTIHMVKSAASNPAPASTSAASAPTPAAVPQNMAAGTAANNLLAGLTGARYAGLANLPSRDLFGADGGMGAPPTEDQMADILSNPMVAQSVNEALNNPAFVDHMINSNPMLANMPNAREMIQSPYFRTMMTNPEALRMAARMRRVMAGGGAGGFPAPGVTDTTEGGAAGAAADSNNNAAAQNPLLIPGLFGIPPGGAGGAGGAPAANPFMDLFGGANPFAAPPTAGTGVTAGAATAPGQTGAAPAATTGPANPAPAAATPGQTAGNAAQQPAPNPFAALFGIPPGGAQGATPAANPFLGGISPEAMQRAMQMFGMGGMGAGLNPAAPPAPADTRPPEERYAEQLRQLNDMGFFDFDRNVAALRRSGGSVQGAIEYLLGGS